MLSVGELDRRITLENYTTEGNKYGALDKSYEEYRVVWAKILYRSGDVNEESDKITAISKIEFFIRNLDLDLLTTETRIFYDEKYYYIEAINEVDGRGMFYQLLTKEKD